MAIFRVVHRLGSFDLEADDVAETPRSVVLTGAGGKAVAVFPADGTTAVVRVDAMAAALPPGELAAKPTKGKRSA